MVMYVDIPDSHHEELRPAINMSSELFMRRDMSQLTAISPRK